MTDEPEWRKEKIAEDEISVLWKRTQSIKSWEQLARSLSQPDDFWTRIEALADECDEILGQHGFPHAANVVLHDGAGNWWRPTPDGPSKPPPGKTWRYTTGSKLAQEQSPGFSDPWYAGRIGKLCRDALARSANPAESALFLCHKIWAIATFHNDWVWRRGQKPSILTGNKQREVLAAHRGAAIASMREGVEARRAAIGELLSETKATGGTLEKHLQKKLLDKFGIKASSRTIRRDLSKIPRT